MFDKGQKIELRYPTCTHVRVIANSPTIVRPITVRGVRDLLAEPLTPLEFLRRPYVARSRWLIAAFDHLAQDFRQFYAGSSLEFKSPGVLRLAVYRDRVARPLRVLPVAYHPTLADRRAMIRDLWRIRHRLSGFALAPDETLRVIADDLDVFG